MSNDNWSEKVERGRALVSEINDRKWELGDLAVEVCPAESHGVNNDHLIDKFAEDIGIAPRTLREYRRVSKSWPDATRVASQTHTTHKYLAGHAEQFQIIEEQTWTYNSLMARLGRKPNPSRVNKDTGEIVDVEQAREFIKTAIASSPELAGTADQALEDRARRSRESRPVTASEPHDNPHGDAMQLVWLLRKAHKALAEAVEYGQNIRGPGADAMVTGVNAEVAWIRAACDVLEAGANNGSLDEQIEAFLETEAGR